MGLACRALSTSVGPTTFVGGRSSEQLDRMRITGERGVLTAGLPMDSSGCEFRAWLGGQKMLEI